ncbi:hypothetical protein ANO11243_074310 [Dothideomycetidae sp. 11243]|nr:hypothetical protein ANO11243_074310 [fungal sp. No.11243]
MFTLRRLTPALRPSSRSLTRPLSTTPRLLKKPTEDKDSLHPQYNEYSKSSDDSAASEHSEAFSRNSTRPEEQLGSKDDALNVSPANKDVSKPRKQDEGGAESSSRQSGEGPTDRKRSSGGSGQEGSYKGGEGKRYDS